MNVLSLFDGISCGQVALERAGIKVDRYFASEIEKPAIRITQKNYPDTFQIGDVTKVSASDLPKIDLIIGGSPCQGFSRNGKHLNFEDPRSKLFFEYVRLLDEIEETNPNVKFLLENVKMKNEWRDVITNYMKVPCVEINSKLLSAQNRPRMYWTNIPFKMPVDQGVRLKDITGRKFVVLHHDKENDIHFDKAIPEDSRALVYRAKGEIRVKQAVKKGYIVAEDGDGINLTFPTSKTRRGRVIKEKSPTLDCSCDVCVLQGNVIRKLSVREMERLQTLPEGYTHAPGIKFDERKRAIGNGWTVDVIAHILKGLK